MNWEKNWTVFTNIKQRKYFRAKWIFGILKISRLSENSTNYNIKVQEWVHNSDELKFVLVHHYYRYCFQSCLSVSLSQSDHTWTCSNIVSGPQPPQTTWVPPTPVQTCALCSPYICRQVEGWPSSEWPSYWYKSRVNWHHQNFSSITSASNFSQPRRILTG